MVNRILLFIISSLPKNIIKFFARKYIAGTTTKEAINCVKTLNNKGFSVTLDILGEYTEYKNEALKITENYNNLYNLIEENDLNCNISVKPTHLGMSLNYDFCLKNFLYLAETAKNTNNYIRIDMENSKYTDLTMQLLKDLSSYYPKNVGIVLQSYLHRS